MIALKRKSMGCKINKGPLLGMRHVQGLLIFFNITVVYISRLNIGVAVVAMTDAETTNPNFHEFDWNEKEISYILSSFYWGYVLTQFLGGVLCRRYGVKLTMGISTMLTAILTILTPSMVIWGGWQAFCVNRFLQGLFQGLLFPCVFQHFAKWSPLEEHNRICAISLTGIDFGVVMALALSGLIAEGPMGWPGISYVSGSLCLAWCILWSIFGANNEKESKFITLAEREYLETSLEHSDNFHKKKIPVPWKAIFTSIPFIALLVTRCAASWGLTTLQAQIPAYLHGVLNMEIKSNALFSALPSLVGWGMTFVFVAIADVLQNRQMLSVTALRKTFNSIGLWIPAAVLLAIGFLNENNVTLAITLMTMNMSVNGAAIISNSVNTVDIPPNHAGILMGIINTSSNFMPLISPLVVGVIVADTSNRYQWQIIFAIAAVIYFVGNLVFVLFGSGLRQPWDFDDYLLPKDDENCQKAVNCDASLSDSKLC